MSALKDYPLEVDLGDRVYHDHVTAYSLAEALRTMADVTAFLEQYTTVVAVRIGWFSKVKALSGQRTP